MNDPGCGEIIAPFLAAVGDRGDLPSLQIIGGNGSAALLHRDTSIDLSARTIDAPASCDLPRLRADGSVRDLDLLVLSSCHEHLDVVQGLAESAIGGRLQVSVFGLKCPDELIRQRQQPLRSTACVFLGDRYVDVAANTGSTGGFKALYPFATPMAIDALDSFQLTIGDREPFPTSHPGATILNYLTRSISGLRAKDEAKVRRMSQQVLSGCPELSAWIHDGPGQPTLELARLIQTLGEPRRNPQPLSLGDALRVEPYRLDDLVTHPGFMASHLSPWRQRAVLELAHAKAQLLRAVESRPGVVSFWQKNIEQRAHRLVHNEL